MFESSIKQNIHFTMFVTECLRKYGFFSPSMNFNNPTHSNISIDSLLQ